MKKGDQNLLDTLIRVIIRSVTIGVHPWLNVFVFVYLKWATARVAPHTPIV